MLLKNNGDGTFTNVAEETRVNLYFVCSDVLLLLVIKEYSDVSRDSPI